MKNLSTKMDIINDYKQRTATAQLEADKYKTLANNYSLLRLAIFALMILAVGLAIKLDDFTILTIAFLVLLFAFMWLVKKQGVFEKKRNYFTNLAAVSLNELESISDYSNIYNNGDRFNNEKHYYSADLDIFGANSLFQLINRCATSIGNFKLGQWLDAPATKDVILTRQKAVAELAGKNDWKLETQALLLFAKSDNTEQLPKLFKYLHIPLNLSGERLLGTYARIAPYILIATFGVSWFFPPLRSLPALIGLINLGIVFSKAIYIRKADLIAGKIGDTLNSYAAVFEKIERDNWESAYCNNLVQYLRKGHTSAKIKELSVLINKLNYHLNLMVGFVLNAVLLWDIRQIIAIENWKRNNTETLETAFDVIAEFEALISLTSLSINYPEWAMPEIAEGDGYTLTAKGLAHPLISSQKRVENDYELNNTFKIDIITGSNMAGKSTFLRTIGINTVLALSGAPVCAEQMKVSVITIISYMRIKDNLNESTSTFKAELDRLQMLLAAVEKEGRVFFLIDEMLRGTNSMDKYLGSKAIIERLISKKGVGLVATHDLQIAELEHAHPNYVRNFYFDIQVKDGEMLFDYKIKHGACKTFNASMLLRRIGIEI